MENLFSVQHLWVYTSQCVDKAEALSNQSSRSWLLVLKNNKKTKPFSAWLLACYAAESGFAEITVPLLLSDVGSLLESPLLSPSAASAASCPGDKASLGLWTFVPLLRVWNLTSSPGTPLHLPLAVFHRYLFTISASLWFQLSLLSAERADTPREL